MPVARINSLIALLDDENEEVQQAVETALLDFNGDASDALAAAGLRLKPKQARLLSQALHPGRQKILRDEWAFPSTRLDAIDGDWESLEGLLRLLSDFLHDGVTIRQSLSDELDLLADAARPTVSTPMELAEHLFKSNKLVGNRLTPFNILNSDLAWCIDQGESNPLGLCLIYMLVGQRLELPIFGCNYPGHFLAFISHDGVPTLIDPFHSGRVTPVRMLLKDHPEISKEARAALKQPCTLTDMLRRVLANLHLSFSKANRPEDATLVEELMLTIPR
ncbi:MAG: transglutaminase family protein [Verrucomicrobiaceae bacterium]